MDITQNLAGLLGNLQRNREAVGKNLAQAELAVQQLDEASLASIKQLIAKWEHPQSLNQFFNAYIQAEGLKKAVAELDTAVAVIQTAIADDSFQADAQAQLTANQAGANVSPLPAAGQSLPSAPANSGAGTAMVADAPATTA
jgi:hypothetical protein